MEYIHVHVPSIFRMIYSKPPIFTIKICHQELFFTETNSIYTVSHYVNYTIPEFKICGTFYRKRKIIIYKNV